MLICNYGAALLEYLIVHVSLTPTAHYVQPLAYHPLPLAKPRAQARLQQDRTTWQRQLARTTWQEQEGGG